MPGTPRIDELRRRLEHDPASIAFAPLAEEYRRAGDLDEAVRVCQAGLEMHPGYLSARVTLGRALAELGRVDEAKAEFEQVLISAPDNLVAIRSMADLHQRRETAPTEVQLAPTESPVAPTSVPVAPTNVPLAPTSLDPAPTALRLRALDAWLAAILADRAERERRS